MLHVVGQLEVGACEKIVACRAGVVYKEEPFRLQVVLGCVGGCFGTRECR